MLPYKMHPLKFLLLLFSLFFVTVFTAPTEPPPAIREGSVISVKPTAFEEKRTAAGASIHPGVVAYISNGKYLIAMVSKNLPLNPPQMPLSSLKPGTTMYGNINLAFRALKEVNLQDLRPWMDEARTQYEPPMTPQELTNLRSELMKYHSWTPAEGAVLQPYVRKRKHAMVSGAGGSGSSDISAPASKHGIVPKNPGLKEVDPKSAKRQRMSGSNQKAGASHVVVPSNSNVLTPAQRKIHPLPPRPNFAIAAH
ncbi:hypothetical protein CVT24_006921 [Panaeolus cyanescens]|uniref:Uncharacterized protein n=1 Tax=Panaeolus cyanescens TaxID=181874 RepID=A0A409VK39_9AGAR|nr:hypothetical protein CVT24_006921 [Panaeolus cyanescens]